MTAGLHEAGLHEGVAAESGGRAVPAVRDVLSVLTLSGEYRSDLQALIGPVDHWYTLDEIRSMAPARLFGWLRTVRPERLYLAAEDANSLTYMPYLVVLASLSGAATLVSVNPDLGTAQIRRWRLLPALGRIAHASIAAEVARLRHKSEISRLSSVPRIDTELDLGHPLIYVKLNTPLGAPIGGAAAHTAGVVNALQREVSPVEYFSLQPPSMVDPAVSVHVLAPPATGAFPVDFYRHHYAATSQVLATVAGNQQSFVYARMSPGAHVGVTLSRVLHLPLVLEYNGSEAWISHNWGKPLPHMPQILAAEEICLRHAHLVSTVSDVLRDELTERGVAPERIVSQPNGVDPRAFDPELYGERERLELRLRHGIPPDACVVTFVGTFGKWHGVDLLARAIRELWETDSEWLLSRKVHFLLVGDGKEMPDVRQTLAGAAFERFVTLTGLVPQESAPAYLATSDAVVAPTVPNPDGSEFFGSPTKLFEYMAMALPIVASDLAQIGQVLRNSLRSGEVPDHLPAENEPRLALLTTPGDQESLISGVRFLVDHPEWRRVLGDNARQEVLQHYTWHSHIMNVVSALRNVSGVFRNGESRG